MSTSFSTSGPFFSTIWYGTCLIPNVSNVISNMRGCHPTSSLHLIQKSNYLIIPGWLSTSTRGLLYCGVPLWLIIPSLPGQRQQQTGQWRSPAGFTPHPPGYRAMNSVREPRTLLRQTLGHLLLQVPGPVRPLVNRSLPSKGRHCPVRSVPSKTRCLFLLSHTDAKWVKWDGKGSWFVFA